MSRFTANTKNKKSFLLLHAVHVITFVVVDSSMYYEKNFFKENKVLASNQYKLI